MHCLRSREVLPCKNGWVLLLPCRDLHAVHKCLCVSVLSGRDVSEPACHASMHILCRGHFRCLEDRRMQQLQRGLLRPVRQRNFMRSLQQRDVSKHEWDNSVHFVRCRDICHFINRRMQELQRWVLRPVRQRYSLHALQLRDVSQSGWDECLQAVPAWHFRCLEDRRMQQLQRGLLRPVHQCYRMQCVPQRDVPRLSRGERMFFVCSRDLFTDQKRHMHQMCSRHVHAIFQFLWLHVVFSWHLSDAGRDDFMHTLFTRHVFAK